MARMGFEQSAFSPDGKSYDSSHYGGYDSRTDGTMSSNGTLLPVSTGAKDAVNRYRGLGEAAAARRAYQVDFGAAQADRANGLQARGEQLQAAELYGQAATGNAPSRAAIMGNQAAGQGLEATLAGSAGARPGGMAAAQMAARQGQGGMQIGAMGQAGGLRAHELNDARAGYMSSMTGIRSGDYAAMGLSQQQAEAQAQAENAQREMNDRMRMQYEQRGFDVNKLEQDRNVEQKSIFAQQYDTRSKTEQANKDSALRFIGGVTSAVGSGGASLSDAAAKQKAFELGVAQGVSLQSGDNAGMSGPRGKAKPAGGQAAAHSYARAVPPAAPGTRDVAVFSRGGRGGSDPMTEQLAHGLAPYEYEYKPEFAGQEGQAPGEKNVGPMAQNMASNPVTGAAVQQGSNGMLQIDMKKATKLSLAAAGHNAQKIRELEAQMAQQKGGR